LGCRRSDQDLTLTSRLALGTIASQSGIALRSVHDVVLVRINGANDSTSIGFQSLLILRTLLGGNPRLQIGVLLRRLLVTPIPPTSLIPRHPSCIILWVSPLNALLLAMAKWQFCFDRVGCLLTNLFLLPRFGQTFPKKGGKRFPFPLCPLRIIQPLHHIRR
jgi:hypothetical protein